MLSSAGRIPFDTECGLLACEHTALMGILNCTPDSFFDGGEFDAEVSARNQAKKLLLDGADIIDVGGESTRPGAVAVDKKEELARVLPVIRWMRTQKDFDNTAISIDTTKAEVARAALGEGADIVNDISALQCDSEMAALIADTGASAVLNHMRGTPRTMQQSPRYDDVVGDVYLELLKAQIRLLDLGVPAKKICLDPGIGFGKSVQDNYKLIWNVSRFISLGSPVLLGMSRKSYIAQTPGLENSDCLIPSLASAVVVMLAGVSVLRVHDVAETREALTMVHALEG